MKLEKYLKSSFSTTDCVEVLLKSDGSATVRNSRHPEGVLLRFSAEDWQVLLARIKSRELDFS